MDNSFEVWNCQLLKPLFQIYQAWYNLCELNPGLIFPCGSPHPSPIHHSSISHPSCAISGSPGSCQEGPIMIQGYNAGITPERGAPIDYANELNGNDKVSESCDPVTPCFLGLISSQQASEAHSLCKEIIPVGHVTLVAISGNIILIPYRFVKSLQLVWRSGT